MSVIDRIRTIRLKKLTARAGYSAEPENTIRTELFTSLAKDHIEQESERGTKPPLETHFALQAALQLASVYCALWMETVVNMDGEAFIKEAYQASLTDAISNFHSKKEEMNRHVQTG